MKKLKQMLSLCLACLMLASFLSVPSVLAAEGDPVFALDLTGFDETAENGSAHGLTDSVGTDNTIALWCTYKPGYGSPAIRLAKDSFTNKSGGTTNFFTMHWSRAWDGKANRRLAVTLPSLANKSITAEYWMQYADDQWSSLLSIRPSDEAATAQAAYVNAVGTQKTVQLRANGSTNNTQYAAENGKWHHVVLQRELEESGGQVITTAKLYLDGVYMGSDSATAAKTEETAAAVFAGAYTSSQYCPKALSVASLKVYEGVLSADSVAAHYADEKDSFTIAKGPEIVSSSPASGGEVNADGAVINLVFDVPIDGTTLADGIRLTDDSGRPITMDNLELSADGLTVTVTASGLKKDGVYTVSVNESLRGAAEYGGLAAIPSSLSFTAVTKDAYREEIVPQDFGWTVGEEHSWQELADKSPYLKGNPYGTNRVGTFYVNDDGALVFKKVGDSAKYDANLSVSAKEPVGYGLYEFSTAVQGSFVQGCALSVIGSKGKSVKLIEHAYTFGTTDYLPIRVEAYAKTAADDWSFTLYNDETNVPLATTTAVRSEFGDFTDVRFYVYYTGSGENNLSFMPMTLAFNPRGVKGGQSITDAQAEISPSADTLLLTFARSAQAETVNAAYIENAKGEKVDADIRLDENGKQLHIAFLEYLTPGETYTLRFGGEDCADYSFTAKPRAVTADNIWRTGGTVCVSVTQPDRDVSAVYIMAVTRDANGRIAAMQTQTVSSAGAVNLDVSAMSGDVTVYCWELCGTHLRPACAPVTLS